MGPVLRPLVRYGKWYSNSGDSLKNIPNPAKPASTQNNHHSARDHACLLCSRTRARPSHCRHVSSPYSMITPQTGQTPITSLAFISTAFKPSRGNTQAESFDQLSPGKPQQQAIARLNLRTDPFTNRASDKVVAQMCNLSISFEIGSFRDDFFCKHKLAFFSVFRVFRGAPLLCLVAALPRCAVSQVYSLLRSGFSGTLLITNRRYSRLNILVITHIFSGTC